MDSYPDSWKKLDNTDSFKDISDYARPLALRLVRMLRPTRVRSLHVTAAFLVVGVVGGLATAAGSRQGFLAAGILFQIKNLLDAVDGSLARAQNRPSRTGRFFDSVSDFVVNIAMFTGIAVALSPWLGPGPAWAISTWGLASALLQCSYYSFFSVAHRSAHREGLISNLDEGDNPPGPEDSFALRLLYRLYLLFYGWQDRWVHCWVRWATVGIPSAGPASAENVPPHPALFSKTHMTRISILGLGTQLLFVSICLLTAAVTGADWPLLAFLVGIGLVASLFLAGDLLHLRATAGSSAGGDRGHDGVQLNSEEQDS